MNKVRRDKILGSRRISNYWWAAIILIGGFSFFLVGILSYIKLYIKNIYLLYNQDVLFLPQGAVMTFYGMTGILISIFLWYTIVLNVGSGYNEFNNETGLITIFRLGFPGKNRALKLVYKIKDMSSIRINIQEGISPKREIYLKTKDRREIPITKVGEPLPLKEIERQAKEIASFLEIKLEGIK
uniref:Photosystem I assembly protein Ycf4 n=1 Tax=Pleurostichidium falkenbergii TaxID=121064 RepID=A0A4D6UW20_9FLOR|nr:photosystem I assembly protein Ycf4 [Pleurostichidium falkenbergii]QCH39637.1 photosystem I assembly protein Ycf4 [Pleurostichidium falkenbergii]